MQHSSQTRYGSFLFLILLAAWAGAEQLPLKAWTTLDGLAHNHINRIRLDSRGYLWFCTDEGLSRFDGDRFLSYTVAHGLPSRTVNDLLEARDGTIWLATDGGVCRFDPCGEPRTAVPKPMFRVHRVSEREEANHVNSMIEEPDGAIWLATSEGLFRLERDGGQARIAPVEIGLPMGDRNGRHVSSVLVDARGRLWAGAISGVYVREPAGAAHRFTMRDGLPDDFVQTLFQDADGSLWGGTRRGGACRLASAPVPGRPVIETCYSTVDGLGGNDVRQIFRAADGRLWFAAVGGLSLWTGGRRPFVNFTTANGLTGLEIYKLCDDPEGNLWLGTKGDGVMRIARAGFLTYGAADGFRAGAYTSAFAGAGGAITIVNRSEAGNRVHFQRFESGRFREIAPYLPAQATLHVNEETGFRTMLGLSAGEDLTTLYRDAHGDLWLNLISRGWPRLVKMESASRRSIDRREAFAAAEPSQAQVFCEDGDGNLWMGFGDAGGIARDRGGVLTVFGVAEGVPKGKIQALYADASRRRLWIGSREGGLGRIDDPGADRPRIVRITTAEGLSSNEILSLTGDSWGRVYAGSNRGVDRLDPDTGRVRRFTAADGLAKGEVLAAARDGEGALWFVTAHEASRLRPVAEGAAASLPIFISGLRIAGMPMKISELGESVVAAREFKARDTSLSIDFIALGFGAGDAPRYQYRLEGADREWSAPTEQRTVNYGGLSPGQYRFQVRALNAAGTVSNPPAEVRFFLPRPVWQRWWFLALLSAATGAALYAAYRRRLAQLLELERVRTRIAADLHDDIGANLTKISILSEVAKQQYGAGGENGLHPLTAIADLSRESVAAMSDIVWAINPRKDNLLDLVRRMRQHAEETLDAAEIALRFTAPEGIVDLRLGADLRRQVYLIFKESLNNLVRHANASHAAIDLCVEGAMLTLRIEDDGRGFDPTREFDGNGLPGMRKRAAGFGGEVRIESQPGRGAAVTLRVPLRPRRRLSLRT